MGKGETIIWNVKHEILNSFEKRDNSIVLFGAWFGKRFADNSRYLYQYLSENKSELGLSHIVWVTRSKKICKEIVSMGYEAYMMDSEESLFYHKKAGIHIICNSGLYVDGTNADILTQYSNGAIKINLWHGLGGIKGVDFASEEYLKLKKLHPINCFFKESLRKLKIYRVFCIAHGGWGDAFRLSTTSFETKIFEQYFCLPRKKFIESGYPRNQSNIKLMQSEIDVIEQIKKSKLSVLYMPTFRKDNTYYTDPLSDGELISFLHENDLLWIEKKHAADNSDLLGDIENSVILRLNSEFDANTILPYVDLVITDYSSVSWDALYHKKPILFYMPDFEYYLENDRGFFLKPEEFIIGLASYNINQLKQVLFDYCVDFTRMLPENEDEIFNKFWGQKIDCEQIWKDIIGFVRIK